MAQISDSCLRISERLDANCQMTHRPSRVQMVLIVCLVTRRMRWISAPVKKLIVNSFVVVMLRVVCQLAVFRFLDTSDSQAHPVVPMQQFPGHSQPLRRKPLREQIQSSSDMKHAQRARFPECLLSAAISPEAAAGSFALPTMAWFDIFLPYMSLFASSSGRSVAPCNETPANNPRVREYVRISA